MQLNTRQELICWIKDSPKVWPLYQHILQTDSQDSAHNSGHLLRVALYALKIGHNCDPHELVAAALLHDLVNLPKNHPDRAKASELSAQAALPLLQKSSFSEPAIGRIQEAIREHSFSRGSVPTAPLAKALQDADRLEAIGAIGIMRVFSTGAKMQADYFDESDPWSKQRSLDDKKYSVDHFFTKLLKLPDSMTTKEGKLEAQKRVKIMQAFLQQLGEEIGDPFCPSPKELD